MSSLVWEKLGKVSRRIFLAKYLFHGGWRSEWGRGCSRSIERDERGRGGGGRPARAQNPEGASDGPSRARSQASSL